MAIPVSPIQTSAALGSGRGRRVMPPRAIAIGSSTPAAMRYRRTARVSGGISRTAALVTTYVLPHTIITKMRPTSAWVRREMTGLTASGG
jgi:hypothetical protein